MERAQKLRENLQKWSTTSAKIRGEIYSKEATEERWNKAIVVSTDNKVMEFDAEGKLVDTTNALTMANTTGFDADEALKAVESTCQVCCSKGFGHSRFILMNAEKEHEYWCRQCYSDSCKDDPLDPMG